MRVIFKIFVDHLVQCRCRSGDDFR